VCSSVLKCVIILLFMCLREVANKTGRREVVERSRTMYNLREPKRGHERDRPSYRGFRGVDNDPHFLIGCIHDELTKVTGERPHVCKVYVLMVLLIYSRVPCISYVYSNVYWSIY
jgi:hypothetical protein